jgi:glycosyltransferase involved in cell wall biosynthesis
MVLLHRRLPGLRLVFAGGGRTLPKWREEANRRNLSTVVEFRGYTTDEGLAHAYASATLFALPSHNEGFGLVYAEAMAHGLPCIGSNYDAASEVISHGVTGFCVPAGNATAIADAIMTLVRFPQLREQFGRAGRARFKTNFTADCYRDRLIAAATGWRDTLG